MTYKKPLLFVLLVISPAVFSQSGSFQKHLQVFDLESFHNFQQTTDSGFVLFGAARLYALPDDGQGFLIKLDNSGTITWEKRFNKSTGIKVYDGGAVFQTSDSGYIVATNRYTAANKSIIYLIKTDALGNLQWSSLYPGVGFSKANCIRQCSDSGYIVVGSTIDSVTSESFGYLFKTDNAGTIQWGRKLPGEFPPLNTLYDVREIPGQGYIAVGGSPTGATILKTDYSGNEIWSKLFFESFAGGIQSRFFAITPSDNSDYIIAGCNNRYNFVPGSYTVHPVLTRIDTGGNVQWMKTIDTSYAYLQSIERTTDNNLIVSGSGRYNPSAIDKNILLKFDISGNLLWSKEYNDATNLSTCVEANADGTYAAVFDGVNPTLFAQSTHLVKTDSTGDLTCDESDYPLTFIDTTVVPTAYFSSSSCVAQSSVSTVLIDYVTEVDDGCGTSSSDENCLFIPNVFTPNADGQNEEFKITYCGDEKYLIRIYDRWGLLQFESTNKDKHWNGINPIGLAATDGTYYYLLNIGKDTYKGFLTLIR